MSKRINEANAHGMRAVLDLLNEAAAADKPDVAEEDTEEVSEAAEMDQSNRAKDSKGQPYMPRADQPGKADIKMRNVGNYADNPLATESVKSFTDYLKETEELNELSPELRDRYRRKARSSQDDAAFNVDLIQSDPERYDPTGEYGQKFSKDVNKREQGIKKSYDPEPAPGRYQATYRKETGYYDIVDTTDNSVVDQQVANSGGHAMGIADRWNRKNPQ